MSQSPELPHVLVIDDDESYLRLMERTLTRDGLRVSSANSGEEGLARAASEAFDIILLDVVMPGMDGYETCHRLKQNKVLRDIPVVFMTASARDDAHVARAFSQGACGYVVKPLSRVDLLTRVRSIIQHRYETMYVQRLHMADALTGLPNRQFLRSRADEALSDAGRYGTPVTMIVAELDDLESTRRTHGEAAEAAVLKQLATFLRSETRRHDTVARWDASRFTVLLPRIPAEAGLAAAQRISRIWRFVNVPTSGTDVRTAINLGIATYTPGPTLSTTTGDLIERGELALQQAREQAEICAVRCMDESASPPTPFGITYSDPKSMFVAKS